MQGKVPVGVTSVAGYTVTLAAAVGAVLAFLKGDRSDQTLGVLASVGVAILAFLSTQLGRYAQAHAAVKKAPMVVAPRNVVQLPNVDDLLDGPGDEELPEATVVPLTDPSSIPADVGDAGAEHV